MYATDRLTNTADADPVHSTAEQMSAGLTRLTPDEQRLVDEEVIRYRARKSLDTPSEGTGTKLWSLLNSGFVLWFLSTIVVGLVTFSLAKIKDQLTQTESARLRLASTDEELKMRLTNMKNELDTLQQWLPDYQASHDDNTDKRGWYGELKQLYLKTQQPPFSRHQELHLLSIDELLDRMQVDSQLAHVKDDQLAALMAAAHLDWGQIMQLCDKEYEAFQPPSTRAEYYSTVKEKMDKVKTLLAQPPLGHWTLKS